MLDRLKQLVHSIGVLIANLIPLWTQLNSIGRSRAISMTALVLFIGSFIIFNDKIYNYLGLIPQITNSAHIFQFTFMTKMYLLYFGLSALGVGSILFSISCPDEVKKFGSLHPFVAAEQMLSTLRRITVMAVEIANHYLKYRDRRQDDTGGFWGIIGFNDRLHTMAYQTFDAIADKTATKFEEIAREGDEDDDAFYSYRGYMNIWTWMRLVSGPPSALRAVAYTLYQRSVESGVDIAVLYFLSRDQLRPLMRILTSIAFIAGFLILFLPTISTFVSIAYLIMQK